MATDRGHREFTEQLADDATRKLERNEHGNQRQAHGNDRETHFAGALQSGLHAAHACLDVPRRVLHYDNGVVHDEAGGQSSAP